MKPTIKLRSFLFACGSLLMATTAHAQLTWDPGSGGTTDGGGAWLGTGEWWDGALNVDWTDNSDAIFGNGGAGGTVTLSGPVTANSITFNSFTGSYTVSGNTLTTSSIDANTGSGLVTISSLLDNGGADLTFGGTAAAVTSRTLANISITGGISGAGGLIKNGPGVLWLKSGTLSYTGDTVVNGGVLRVQTSGYIGGTPGNLTLNGGVAEAYWSETFTRSLGSGSGQVQLTGGASGFSEHGSNGLTIRLNNDATTAIVWGSTHFNPSTLVLQTEYADNTSKVTFDNTLDLNGAQRTIQVSAGEDGRASAEITKGFIDTVGGGGITKTGDGLMILNFANNGIGSTYTGPTRILGGVVQFGTGFNTTWNGEALPSTSNLEINNGIASGYWVFDRALGTGAGEVQITGGRSGFSMKQGDRPGVTFGGDASSEVQWGSAEFDPTILVLNDAQAGASATLYLQNKLDLNGATRTIETGVAGGNGTTAGDAWGRVVGAGAMLTNDVRDSDVGNSAGLVKTGAGKLGLTGTNTYGGGTSVSEGGIFFDRTVSMPGTGDVSLADGTEIIVTVGGSGWTTGTSGVGTLGGLLAGDGGSGTATVSYSGAHTIGLNIDGGSQDFSGNIGNVSGSGATSLAIYSNSNSGTMALSGNNTYSGTTTLEDGTLGINSATAISTGNLIINGGSLDNTSGSAVTLSTNNAQNWNTNFTFVGSNDLDMGTGNATINANRTITVSAGKLSVGAIVQTGSNRQLNKQGAGTLEINGNSTYTGTTTVSAGSLIINGSTSTSSAVTVASNGTLGGSGTVGGATTVNGALRPGNSPGLLTFTNSLELAGTAATTMEIDGASAVGTDYDGVNVGTSLTYGGALTFDLGTAFGSGSYTFNLFDFGSQSGSFSTVDLAGLYSGSFADAGGGVWQATTNGGNESWTFTQSTGDLGLTVIPEPNVAALLGGLGAMLLLRRRR